MKYYFLSLFILSVHFLCGQNELELYKQLSNPTPILEDLHELCDEIGGRVTGTEANLKSVDWAMRKFKEAGIDTYREAFEMKRKWEEISAEAQVFGASNWKPKITCRAFSKGIDNIKADLVYVGKGSNKDFKKKKNKIKGNYILVETPVMSNLTQLFLEYINAVEIENNAVEYGALGVVYMSSRKRNYCTDI